MKTKLASIEVMAVRLVCPECGEIISASNGVQVIREDMANEWDRLSKAPMNCTHCNRPFRLPANPFKATSGK